MHHTILTLLFASIIANVASGSRLLNEQPDETLIENWSTQVEIVDCNSQQARECEDCEACIPCIDSPWLPWCENDHCVKCADECMKFVEPCVLADQDCNNEHVHGCYDCIPCVHCLFDHEAKGCDTCEDCLGCADTVSCLTEDLLSPAYLTYTGDCDAPEAECIEDCRNCIPCIDNPFLPWCDQCEQCEDCVPFVHCVTDDLNCDDAAFCGEICPDHCLDCVFNPEGENCGVCEQCLAECEKFVPCVETTQHEDPDCFSEEVNNCRENCFECSACLGDPTLPWCRDSCHQCKVCERFVEPCLLPLLDCESDEVARCEPCVECLECEFNPEAPQCASPQCTECDRCHRFIPCVGYETPVPPEHLPRCEDHGFFCGNGGCDIDDCCGTPWEPENVKDCCHSWPCHCHDWNTMEDCTCSRDGHSHLRCNGSRHKEPECPELLCAMHCEHGFKKDENGCQMCTCEYPHQNCPDGWSFHMNSNSCIQSRTEHVNYDEARRICHEQGAELPIVESEEMNEFLRENVGGDFWLGLDDRNNEGSWMWLDWTMATDRYNNFRAGEPNDFAGMEDCASFEQGGTWNDLNCETSMRVVCQRKEHTCPPVMCPMEMCPMGFKKDMFGCQTCECEEPCPVVQCPMECEFGFIHDHNGCMQCECHQPEQIVEMRLTGYEFHGQNDVVKFEMYYDTSPVPMNHLVGVGLTVHYPHGLILEEHDVHFDESMFGDFYDNGDLFTLQYADIHGNWPGVELPLNLASIQFRTTEEFHGGEIRVHFSSTAGGFVGRSESIMLHRRYGYECPEVQCEMHCDHGFKVDERGCEYCECNEIEEGNCESEEAKCIEDCRNCIPCLENPFLPWCDTCHECERCTPYVHCVMDELDCDSEEAKECGDICEPHCLECAFNEHGEGCDRCHECHDRCERFVPCVKTTQWDEDNIDCESQEVQNCAAHCEHCVPCFEHHWEPWCEDMCQHCEVCERFIEPCRTQEPEPCPEMHCDMECDNGFKVNERGCEFCECNTECPENWTWYNGDCFQIFEERRNFDDSRHLCQDFGADLPIIESAEMNAWIFERFGGDWWLGVTDREHEGIFKWIDGVTDRFSNWSHGEPNNHGGQEDCATVFGEKLWNDLGCGAHQRVLCQTHHNREIVDPNEEGNCESEEAKCVEDCRNCIPCLENPFLPWCDTCQECERCTPYVHCVMDELDCDSEEANECGEVCEPHCLECVFNEHGEGCDRCHECHDRCERFVPCVTTTQWDEDNIDCESQEVQNCGEHCHECVPCLEHWEPWCEDKCQHCEVCERFIEPCRPEEPALPLPINNFEAAKQKTFVLVKPDGVERGLVGDIMSRFESKGFATCGTKMLRVEDHFVHAYYPEMAGHLLSGPVVAMCWMGMDAVEEAKTLIGDENPEHAGMGTIRGMYAMSIERNVIYSAENVERASWELELWFPEGIIEFYPTVLRHVYEF